MRPNVHGRHGFMVTNVCIFLSLKLISTTAVNRLHKRRRTSLSSTRYRFNKQNTIKRNRTVFYFNNISVGQKVSNSLGSIWSVMVCDRNEFEGTQTEGNIRLIKLDSVYCNKISCSLLQNSFWKMVVRCMVWYQQVRREKHNLEKFQVFYTIKLDKLTVKKRSVCVCVYILIPIKCYKRFYF